MAAGTLLVFMGMIASGKSYLAEALAKSTGYPCYNSDRVRKELAGLSPQTRQKEEVEQGIYTPEFSRKTYDRLIELARQCFTSSKDSWVLLDGSYQVRSERDRVVKELALYSRIVFVHCICSEEMTKERMVLRARDPEAVSDGRLEIYFKQKDKFEFPDELAADQLITIDTDNSLDALLESLKKKLKIIGLLI